MLFMVMDKVQGRLYLVQADHKYHARRRVRDAQLEEMSNEERERKGYALVDMTTFGVCEVQADKIDFMEVEPTWVEML
jgi:RNA polymerase-binding transcription factor DksA